MAKTKARQRCQREGCGHVWSNHGTEGCLFRNAPPMPCGCDAYMPIKAASVPQDTQEEVEPMSDTTAPAPASPAQQTVEDARDWLGFKICEWTDTDDGEEQIWAAVKRYVAALRAAPPAGAPAQAAPAGSVSREAELKALVKQLWRELGRDQYYVGQELTQRVANALGGVDTVHQGFVAALPATDATGTEDGDG